MPDLFRWCTNNSIKIFVNFKKYIDNLEIISYNSADRGLNALIYECQTVLMQLKFLMNLMFLFPR